MDTNSVQSHCQNVFNGRNDGQEVSDGQMSGSETSDERNGHLSEDNLPTPPQKLNATTVRTIQLTKSEQEARFKALENRIGAAPHTTTELLRILKQAAKWDVDRAEALFRTQRSALRNKRKWQADLGSDDDTPRSRPAKSPRYEASAADVFGPTYLGGFTVEEHMAKTNDVSCEMSSTTMGRELTFDGNADHERREAVFVLADIVWQKHDVAISRGEAALVMGLASWYLQRASKYCEDEDCVKTTQAALSEFFDRMRLPPGRHADKKQAQSERDQRVALLLTYTGYPSWYSAQLHLTKYGDDLVKAIAGWVRDGIEPIRHKADKPGKRSEGTVRRQNFDDDFVPMPNAKDVYRKLRFDNDNIWAPELQFFMMTRRKTLISRASRRHRPGHEGSPHSANPRNFSRTTRPARKYHVDLGVSSITTLIRQKREHLTGLVFDSSIFRRESTTRSHTATIGSS